MVLETLIDIEATRKNYYWVFIIAAFVTAVSVLIASLLFPRSPGMFSVVFTTFGLLPFMVKLMRTEAKEEELEAKRQKGFFHVHKDVIYIYTSLFLGEVFAWLILYLFLPHEIAMKIFRDQITEINLIRGRLTALGTYEKIVLNNLGVLSLCVLLSFLYSSGAIFILSWNASVLAAAIGMTAESMGGLHTLPLAVLVFLPHGSLEILAYFLGGIAGGMISAEVFRPNKNRWLSYVFWDAVSLIAVAALLIIIAGAIETAAIYLR